MLARVVIPVDITGYGLRLFVFSLVAGLLLGLFAPDRVRLSRFRKTRGDHPAPHQPDVLFRLALLALGVIILLGAALLPVTDAQRAIPYGIGIALLASAGYSLLERLTGNDPDSRVADRLRLSADEIKQHFGENTHTLKDQYKENRKDLVRRLNLKRQFYDVGLTSFLPSPQIETLFRNIGSAKTIDMLYNTGQTVAVTQIPALEAAILTRACRVRILISDPDMSYWESTGSACSAAAVIGVPKEVRLTREILEALKGRLEKAEKDSSNGGEKQLRGTLEVKQFQFAPTCSMLFVDGSAWITPYVPYLRSSRSPCFCVANDVGGGRLFKLYCDAYRRVWDEAAEIGELTFPSKQPGDESFGCAGQAGEDSTVGANGATPQGPVPAPSI